VAGSQPAATASFHEGAFMNIRMTLTARRIAVAAVVFAGGCGGSEGPTSSFLTYRQAMDEYLEATTQLELAPGKVWNDHPIALQELDENGQPTYYEAGVGSQQADFQWFCSWADAALDGETTALDHLADFPTFGVWAKMDDNGHSLFTQILNAADLGDLSGLSGYVSGNCS
jgi:hypothetical protein